MIATTYEGRPTKLEGNPLVPSSNGGTDLFAQAAVLDLYDPDRATAHTQGERVLSAGDVTALFTGVGNAHAAEHGAGLAFLADGSSSPTRNRMVRALRARFPKAIWSEYEPVTDEPPGAASP